MYGGHVVSYSKQTIGKVDKVHSGWNYKLNDPNINSMSCTAPQQQQQLDIAVS